MLTSKQYHDLLKAKLKRFSRSQEEWKKFLATSARITMNGFLPYKFNLPQWFLQTCDTEFENYRMYISNIKR